MTGKKAAAVNIETIPPEITQEPQDNIPADLQSFLFQHCQENSFVCKVYQIRQNTKGGQKSTRELIDEYENTYPSIRDLGIENGAGTYEYFIYIRKPNGSHDIKTFRINLAARWDMLRDENLQARGINPATRPDGISQSIGMMRDMMEVMKPLFAAQASGGGNPSAIMESMMEMQGKILTQNFTSQMEMQKKIMGELDETRKNILSESDGNGADNALISEIMGTLKSFVPLLLVAPQKAAQAATAQAIDARPDVRALVDHAGRRAALVERVKKEFPPATAQKVLNVLSGITEKEKINGHKNNNALKRPAPRPAPIRAGSARPGSRAAAVATK